MTDHNNLSAQTKEYRISLAVFILYVVLLLITIGHHELWGDELHSWNIAKASSSFSDLIANSRYEGHPPVWYTLMWLLSKCTHNLVYLQGLQFVIIGSAMFLLLLRSRFPLPAKILLPFGYYFLFEYAALSRNYAIGLLLAFSICILLQRKEKTNLLLYYVLLFLLSNTHLLCALLAASLHLYFLLSRYKPGQKAQSVIHLLAGAIVLLPALYFIFPPSDSELSMSFWMRHWNAGLLTNTAAAPAKAMLPVPDWRNHHFWNTNMLADRLPPLVTGIVSLVFTGVMCYILKQNKKALTLFLINLLLTLIIAFIFPLTSARYVGFIYIGFIVACWLYFSERPLPRKGTYLLYALLAVQVCGSMVAVPRDIRQPFSYAYKVNELLREIPPGEKAVTDYWCLNNVAAYAGKPFYCLELKKEVSFLCWDEAFAKIIATPDIYTDGLNYLFRQKQLTHVMLLSSNSPEDIAKRDPTAQQYYTFRLKDSRTGSIEKHSDLYLYEVTPVNAHN